MLLAPRDFFQGPGVINLNGRCIDGEFLIYSLSSLLGKVGLQRWWPPMSPFVASHK